MAPGTVVDRRPQVQDDRFELLDNSAGLSKGQVVTASQIKAAHGGVTIEDWTRRGIVRRTDKPVTPQA